MYNYFSHFLIGFDPDEDDSVNNLASENVTKVIAGEKNVSRKTETEGMPSQKPINQYKCFLGLFRPHNKLSILKREGRAIATKQIGFSSTIANEKGLQVHDNEIVHFDTVLHNDGNGFNKESGIFTCPLSGTYFFTLSVMTSHGYHTAVHLLVNGQIKGNSYANGADSWDQGSISNIFRCEAGQNVWISVYGGTYIHGDYYTSFSGFLLWGDATGSS
ncbi:hypothetical protein CHS0354_017974 [Potamilus streckersoni]|uniref:C1q domain-containing protein n=1 Tax=Potamilus streckersoni TaxID=2493646 RepID=A0AAE0VJL0_9BIVA|nr:hypothetical protein CHS0354_017974 [Potamilus streckersoni]